LFIRAVFLTLVTLLCAVAAPDDSPVAGRWAGRSPNPIGRTEDVEIRIVASGDGLSGVLHTPERDIALDKVQLQGRRFTFDATRELRGRNILYHYDGAVSVDSIEFTVQNDDGSSFFRFVVHRAP
jgi:hypothetical protein